jgi:acyl dehydratase
MGITESIEILEIQYNTFDFPFASAALFDGYALHSLFTCSHRLKLLCI